MQSRNTSKKINRASESSKTYPHVNTQFTLEKITIIVCCKGCTKTMQANRYGFNKIGRNTASRQAGIKQGTSN